MSTPKPTIEESLALIARQLLEVNNRLGMINGWMDGQEKISLAQSKQLGKMQKDIRTLAARRVQDGALLRAATDAIVKIVPQLEGVTELSRSTYDMIVDLKSPGGEDESTKQAAQ